MRLIALCRVAAAASVIAGVAAGSASGAPATCRDDLIKADQDFAKSRSELQGAANAAPAVKCRAYRRHIASLAQVRRVFARCDSGTDKTKNAAQTTSALAEFTRQMNETCKK